MNKKRLVEGVEKLSPWFHRIELTPYGIVTKEKSFFGEDSDHPNRTWSYVSKCFPNNLSGKTVLDIGCNAGFYSFEAKKRGASSVLGIDATNHHIRQARFVKAVFELDQTDFQRKSLYELDPLIDGQYDLVLALGLVYHLKHLILGLETLYKVTRETLILESAVARPEMSSSYSANANKPLDKSKVLKPVSTDLTGEYKEYMPLFYVKNDAYSLEAPQNWFIPTEETLIGMLRDVGFSNIETFDIYSGRSLIRARKLEAMSNSTRPIWLKATLQAINAKPTYRVGESIELIVLIENRDLSTWLCIGIDKNHTGQVRLDAVLTNKDDPLFYCELNRVDIPNNIKMGEKCELKLCLTAPTSPGKFALELDMLSEHVCFFQEVGSHPITIPINVTY